MSNTFEIPFSKRTTYIAFTGITITQGIILHNFKEIIQYILNVNSLRLLIYISIVLLIIFGLFLFIIYRLFKPRIALILDETGFTDRSNYANPGHLKWQDISEIKQAKDASDDILLFFLKNPEEYLNKISDVFSLKLLERNQKIYGTCFLLNTKAFQYDTIELIKLIKNQHQLHKVKEEFPGSAKFSPP
jgi:hypothetical protein